MKGVLQGYDASAREIPGAAPSAAVPILAAQVRSTMPHELPFIISALLRCFSQYPCPCPVSPNLDLDVQASLQVVLILDYHGRDSSRLPDYPLFFQWLLEWCSMITNPDPNNFRTAMAEALAENPPERVLAIHRAGRRHVLRPAHLPVRRDLGRPPHRLPGRGGVPATPRASRHPGPAPTRPAATSQHPVHSAASTETFAH